ncbi:putative collagen alpha-5 chain [Erysiphe necator]|uniref:Putative collagen alpha-5 chain n=1 Tax=Uncinula necator TaxID=52586 RepID=A0A0B1P658_UNCNE|nr:putative collagen alpha-5 chain [Erysiphe necator]
MKSLSFLLILGLIYDVQGWANETEPVVWVTITTDMYTTFCPSSTKLSYGPDIFTAPAPQTVTITECPCICSEIIGLPSLPTQKASLPTPNILPKPSLTPISLSQIWVTVTETVSELTTFCPSPTELVQNSKTYTVTEATTLTITDCPCTVSSMVPGTIQSYTTSIFTTYYTGSTTITLSGITYPVPSSGSITIPLVEVSTVIVKTDSKNSYPLPSSSTIPYAEASLSSLIDTAKPSSSFTNIFSGQIPSQPVAITQASLSTNSAVSEGSSKTSSSKVVVTTKASSSKLNEPTPQVTANIAAKFDAEMGAAAAAAIGFAAIFL